MKSSDLELGDILLLKDTPTNTSMKHKGIKAGQALTSLNSKRDNQGLSELVHAQIYVGDGWIAEASGAAGEVIARPLRYGKYKVYRCKRRRLAHRAIDAADNWASQMGVGYAKSKAILSVFHSDSFGKHGKARAKHYAAHIDGDSPFGGSGAFCSEFVIACYQAAAWDMDGEVSGELLSCDAKHCSVRALHDRLVRDTTLFQFVGGVMIPLVVYTLNDLSVAETI